MKNVNLTLNLKMRLLHDRKQSHYTGQDQDLAAFPQIIECWTLGKEFTWKMINYNFIITIFLFYGNGINSI